MKKFKNYQKEILMKDKSRNYLELIIQSSIKNKRF